MQVADCAWASAQQKGACQVCKSFRQCFLIIAMRVASTPKVPHAKVQCFNVPAHAFMLVLPNLIGVMSQHVAKVKFGSQSTMKPITHV